MRRLRFYEPIGRAFSIISRTGATPSSINSPHSVLHRIKISSQLSGSICSQNYAAYNARSSVRYFGNQPWRVHNRNNNWGSNNPFFGGKNVLYAIMGLNVITTGAWYLAQKDFYYRKFMSENFLASANGVLGHFRVHTLVTAIFFNHDFSQLVTNLFSIYLSFTPGGGARFAAIYLAGGLLSTTSQVIMPKREFESASGENTLSTFREIICYFCADKHLFMAWSTAKF